MDANEFDRLARAVASRPSRRGIARGLSALTLVGLIDQPPEVPAKKKKKKVTLCHEGQTITVGKKAKKAHLKHGDTLGACPPSPAPPPVSPPPPTTTTTLPPGACPQDAICGSACASGDPCFCRDSVAGPGALKCIDYTACDTDTTGCTSDSECATGFFCVDIGCDGLISSCCARCNT